MGRNRLYVGVGSHCLHSSATKPQGLAMLQFAMDPETSRLVRVIVFGVVATVLITGILAWIGRDHE